MRLCLNFAIVAVAALGAATPAAAQLADIGREAAGVAAARVAEQVVSKPKPAPAAGQPIAARIQDSGRAGGMTPEKRAKLLRIDHSVASWSKTLGMLVSQPNRGKDRASLQVGLLQPGGDAVFSTYAWDCATGEVTEVGSSRVLPSASEVLLNLWKRVCNRLTPGGQPSPGAPAWNAGLTVVQLETAMRALDAGSADPATVPAPPPPPAPPPAPAPADPPAAAGRAPAPPSVAPGDKVTMLHPPVPTPWNASQVDWTVVAWTPASAVLAHGPRRSGGRVDVSIAYLRPAAPAEITQWTFVCDTSELFVVRTDRDQPTPTTPGPVAAKLGPRLCAATATPPGPRWNAGDPQVKLGPAIAALDQGAPPPVAPPEVSP